MADGCSRLSICCARHKGKLCRSDSGPSWSGKSRYAISLSPSPKESCLKRIKRCGPGSKLVRFQQRHLTLLPSRRSTFAPIVASQPRCPILSAADSSSSEAPSP
ncbi:hypothetical protein GW17_00018989 [Ensete ventricosum]|nr:hypothetical protein GW17_00018989 [Ensete ventricosum]